MTKRRAEICSLVWDTWD